MDFKTYIMSKSEPGLTWVGIRHVHEEREALGFRDGEIEYSLGSLDEGVMLEVLVNGCFGYAATQDLSPKGLDLAFSQALKLATLLAPHKLWNFGADVRPSNKGRYQTEDWARRFEWTEMNALLKAMCGKLKASEKVIKTSVRAELRRSQSHIFSTSGADIQQNFAITVLNGRAVASHQGQTQTRTMGFESQKSAQAFSNVDDILNKCQRAGTEAIELLDADECPNDNRDLVLASDQMVLQIHESIGHPLELDRILGDERNYAGWSFVKLEDFGNLRYGSDLLNVSFDPSVPGELATFGFDDHGTRAEKKLLIEKGILKLPLGGLESQQRSGLEGVSTTRACAWFRPPIDRMSNLNIEPGESRLEDMIGQIEKGVYMQTNKSWSIDDYRNKFQFGCEYAKLIENGKLTRTVRNPNYRGQTESFWKGLFAVGNLDTLSLEGTTNCGKGEPNQAIHVGHATPACAFRGVDVFGGAK